MTTFTYLPFREDIVKFGDFYSWWLANTPKDGEYWKDTVYEKGQNISSSHARDRDGKYRDGGNWLMYKRSVMRYGEVGTTYRSGAGKAYTGFYYASDNNDYSYVDGYISDAGGTEQQTATMQSYGAQAYAALKPDTPDFSPLTSLYELKDVPRNLLDRFKKMRRKAKRVRPNYWKKAGNYHLMIQFGWLPLFRDILDFCQAYDNRKRRFDQMLRDEGRPVRRRRNLMKSGNDKDHSVTPWADVVHPGANNPFMKPVHVTQCYGGGLATTQTKRNAFTNVWCAGRSRYILPPGPRDEQWKKGLYKRILGLSLQPNTVYNAMPWTWLFDYFTTLGSVVDALSGGIADRVVFDYAYIMHHKEVQTKQTFTQYVYKSAGGTGRVSSVRNLLETRKSRISASPFGFGFVESDLTLQQAGILGALGLSRL